MGQNHQTPVKPVVVLCKDQPFAFVQNPDEPPFHGRLVLSPDLRQQLRRLQVWDDDDEGLDENGDRLPAEVLFGRSPWSYASPTGPVPLLCRFLDFATGSVSFQTPETYPGDLFAWMNTPKPPDRPGGPG